MGQSHEHQLNLTVGLCNVLLTYFRLPGTQLRIEPFSKCEKRRKKVFYVGKLLNCAQRVKYYTFMVSSPSHLNNSIDKACYTVCLYLPYQNFLI